MIRWIYLSLFTALFALHAYADDAELTSLGKVLEKCGPSYKPSCYGVITIETLEKSYKKREPTSKNPLVAIYFADAKRFLKENPDSSAQRVAEIVYKSLDRYFVNGNNVTNGSAINAMTLDQIESCDQKDVRCTVRALVEYLKNMSAVDRASSEFTQWGLEASLERLNSDYCQPQNTRCAGAQMIRALNSTLGYAAEFSPGEEYLETLQCQPTGKTYTQEGQDYPLYLPANQAGRWIGSSEGWGFELVETCNQSVIKPVNSLICSWTGKSYVPYSLETEAPIVGAETNNGDNYAGGFIASINKKQDEWGTCLKAVQRQKNSLICMVHRSLIPGTESRPQYEIPFYNVYRVDTNPAKLLTEPKSQINGAPIRGYASIKDCFTAVEQSGESVCTKSENAWVLQKISDGKISKTEFKGDKKGFTECLKESAKSSAETTQEADKDPKEKAP